MSYSNKTTGNITIIKPTSDFSLISNYAIHDKELSHIAFRILCYFASKPSYWDIKKEYALEEIKTSSDTYSKAMGELISKGYISEEKKSKGKAKGFDYFYTINTAIVDPKNPPLERIRDPKNSAIRDRKKPCIENIVISSNEDKKPSDTDSYTRQENLGSIYNTISSNTINNTKEKINNKKEGELMSYESTVKLMRDKLVYSGRVENLIKEFGIEEVNKHLQYLDYFELDKSHENYKKNLTFAFLESLRNNLPAPSYYQQIESDKAHNQRLLILEPVLKLLKITSQDRIDLYLEICRNINYYRLQDKLNKDEYTKQGIDFANRRSLRSRQYELSLEEKSKLIEDLTLKFYKDKNTRIELAKKLVEYDIKKVLNLVKITLTDNKYSTISLKTELEEFKGDVNKYLFNLEIWVLNLSNKEVMEEVLI